MNFTWLMDHCSCKNNHSSVFILKGVKCATLPVLRFFRVAGKEMEQVCLCSFRPNSSRNIAVQMPVVQSRFVQAGGYVKFASSAVLQQSNEITVACSLAANHVGGICFDAIPTSPYEAHTAPSNNLPH